MHNGSDNQPIAAGGPGDDSTAATRSIVPSSSVSGNIIGPYTLLELIGEGGMGQVWLAEQKEPVRRRIAIKLIKVGMDTQDVVARFGSERQALALMNHPAIAKVLDGGSTPDGRPYFVMEYVAGMPITTYCDKHKLTMRQRLELFIHVCEGVQHAHQKAIIHRDLKPSNILVSEVDGKPMPRIIDFGVAKATSQSLTDNTMYTRVGAILGTLEYMSPEQADSAGNDIDTRTDVYSLGVVLYELLAGALPLDFRKLALDQALRLLREQDAPRPSTKLRMLGGDSKTAAQNRGTDPPTLARQLQGDADAITLKAVEKDRARRYATPVELAADIERYLRNEPVAARPASARYRAQKYVRRHRLGVAMTGVGLTLLIAFAVLQTIQLRRTTRERNRADRITEFMSGMFRVSEPSEARGNTVTAREILDKGSKDIDTGLSNDPELQATMMYIMANTYYRLGLYSRAQPLVERGIEIQRRVLGPDHPDTLRSMYVLAYILRDGGHLAEAEELSRETLKIQQRVVGLDHPDTLGSMSNLAITFTYEGHYAEAEKLHRETLKIQRRVLGSNHPSTLLSMNNLAITLMDEGNDAEAEKLYRETLDIQRRVLGPDHPDTLLSMSNLAITLTNQGHYAEAEELFRETLDIQRRVLGPDHRHTLTSQLNLAVALTHEGHYVEAESLFRETLDVQRRVLGPDHPSTLESLESLAINLSHQERRYGEAEQLFREAIGRAKKANQQGVLGLAWYNFACGAAIAGRHDEALEYLRQAIEDGFEETVDAMASDIDLKSLRGNVGFEALLAKLRQGTAAKQR
jgi:non-specific serine/threonine protein kinase/serine/threonine-protein kinase